MERKTLSASVALLLILGAVTTDGHIFNLQKMIKQVTGKNALVEFAMYGCHCGLGGSRRPVDDIDWCCHYHDCCYGRMIKNGCKPKSDGYSHTYWAENVTCGGRTQCQQQICGCDRNFALCLKKHLGSYKKFYRFHLNFFCRGPTPTC